ncbi:MAG: trigger factor [Clostridiales bacterium]|nr:trigger factor [Clostridiales bacterium]
MKKRIALITCIALVVTTLTACGGLNPYDYVTLPDYSSIPVTVELVEVTDEEVDAYIDSALQSAAVSAEITDGTVENGDTVNIDYVGKMDGEVFEGGSSAEGGYDLVIGSGSFIDGFEQGLIGAALGANLDLELAFPDPYENNPDYSGKAVSFNVTVNKITRTTIPELTDEVVATLEATCTTVAEYRDFVYNTLLEQEETAHTEAIQNNAMVYIQDNSTLKDPPEELSQEYLASLTKSNEAQIAQYMSYYGITREEFFAYNNTTEEEWNASTETYAKGLAQQSLVLRAVAKKEGLKLTEDEINTFAAEEATAGSFESTEAYIEEIGQERIEVYLLAMKVYEKLLDYAVVTDATAEEVAAAAAEAAADTTTTDTTEEVTAE